MMIRVKQVINITSEGATASSVMINSTRIAVSMRCGSSGMFMPMFRLKPLVLPPAAWANSPLTENSNTNAKSQPQRERGRSTTGFFVFVVVFITCAPAGF